MVSDGSNPSLAVSLSNTNFSGLNTFSTPVELTDLDIKNPVNNKL
nr:MAG TPA: hypothetical protein [Caudoviricetes sp.]